MQEALQEAEKYASRCEALAALMEEGKGVLERAQAEQAERARAAAEEAEAAAAAAAEAEAEAAALRLQMEQELSHMEQERARMEQERAALALRMQQVQAQLGVAPPAAPQLEEEALCVVCMDAPKQHVIVPCGHQCVCEACAQQLTQTTSPSCPVCRAPIQETTRVYK
jgi:hypothetical protein